MKYSTNGRKTLKREERETAFFLQTSNDHHDNTNNMVLSRPTAGVLLYIHIHAVVFRLPAIICLHRSLSMEHTMSH